MRRTGNYTMTPLERTQREKCKFWNWEKRQCGISSAPYICSYKRCTLRVDREGEKSVLIGKIREKLKYINNCTDEELRSIVSVLNTGRDRI